MAERTLNEEAALTKMRGFIFGFSITRSIALATEPAGRTARFVVA